VVISPAVLLPLCWCAVFGPLACVQVHYAACNFFPDSIPWQHMDLKRTAQYAPVAFCIKCCPVLVAAPKLGSSQSLHPHPSTPAHQYN
jgi:hypothetical protein